MAVIKVSVPHLPVCVWEGRRKKIKKKKLVGDQNANTVHITPFILQGDHSNLCCDGLLSINFDGESARSKREDS